MLLTKYADFFNLIFYLTFVPFFENYFFVEGGDQSDWKYELSLHLGFEGSHKNFHQDILSFRGASFCEQAEGLKKCSKSEPNFGIGDFYTYFFKN